jgi:hypothetical protein
VCIVASYLKGFDSVKSVTLRIVQPQQSFTHTIYDERANTQENVSVIYENPPNV